MHTTLPAGHHAPHVEAHYRFLRAAVQGDALGAEGDVLRPGRAVGHAPARLLGPEGRLLAVSSSTHAVVAAIAAAG